MSEHYPKARVEKMISMIDKMVNGEKIFYKRVLRTIKINFTVHERIQLMHFLTGIVTADGLLTKAESTILIDIAKNIRLPSSMVATLLKRFNFITEEEKKRRSERQKVKSYSTAMHLKKALVILGLEENATTKEIKKAYRKLAMLHHPDRLIHLGEEHQIMAKIKFQEISDAYEYIKEKKGFS